MHPAVWFFCGIVAGALAIVFIAQKTHAPSRYRTMLEEEEIKNRKLQDELSFYKEKQKKIETLNKEEFPSK